MFALRFPIPIDLAIFCVGLRFLEKGIAPVRQIEVDGVLPLAGGIVVMLVDWPGGQKNDDEEKQIVPIIFQDVLPHGIILLRQKGLLVLEKTAVTCADCPRKILPHIKRNPFLYFDPGFRPVLNDNVIGGDSCVVFMVGEFGCIR